MDSPAHQWGATEACRGRSFCPRSPRELRPQPRPSSQLGPPAPPALGSVASVFGEVTAAGRAGGPDAPDCKQLRPVPPVVRQRPELEIDPQRPPPQPYSAGLLTTGPGPSLPAHVGGNPELGGGCSPNKAALCSSLRAFYNLPSPGTAQLQPLLTSDPGPFASGPGKRGADSSV